MSNEITQQFRFFKITLQMLIFSASMAIFENAENVIKAEFNKLKRKLEETEAELEVEKKKSKQLDSLKALVAGGVKFIPKRAKISMSLTNCAEQLAKKEFAISSDPVEVAGFQWKLIAEGGTEVFEGYPANWLGLYLCPYPPKHYTGPYEFDVNFSFRVLGVFSAEDITKRGEGKFKHDNPGSEGWGGEIIESKELLDPKNGFLHGDGKIEVEVDFTVKTATLDHFLVDNEDGEESGNQENLNNE